MTGIVDFTRPSRRAVLAAGASALLLPRFAHAAISPADQADVSRIEAYLNTIHSFVSRFDQVSGSGAAASGIISLQRPGKMRIEYDMPNPILLVATRGQVYFYDGKLDQVSTVSLDDTPAWFLLQDNLKLSGDILVQELQRAPNAIRLTVTETKRAARGRVTLTFNDNPLVLRQWTVLDAQNKTVTVTLNNPQFNAAIDPQKFVWSDPHQSQSGR